MTDCNCPIKHDWSDEQEPCNDENNGRQCTQPKGHDGRRFATRSDYQGAFARRKHRGAHMACTPAQHPVTTWE